MTTFFPRRSRQRKTVSGPVDLHPVYRGALTVHAPAHAGIKRGYPSFRDSPSHARFSSLCLIRFLYSAAMVTVWDAASQVMLAPRAFATQATGRQVRPPVISGVVSMVIEAPLRSMVVLPMVNWTTRLP